MTLVSRISACALAVLMAIPLAAQTPRRRAVSPTANIIAVLLTITDASNGVPVENAVVTYGTQTFRLSSGGQIQLSLPVGKPSTITIDHPAFNSLTTTITAQAGVTNYSIKLTSKPGITIKTKSSGDHVVDIGTAQFAYEIPFSSIVRTDNANFCKTDGTDFTPDKSEFTRITGPAVSAAASQCCQNGNVLAVNVEMKSGAKMLVYFKDSCGGNDIDFLGREKTTGRFQYYRFTDILEVDFP